MPHHRVVRLVDNFGHLTQYGSNGNKSIWLNDRYLGDMDENEGIRIVIYDLAYIGASRPQGYIWWFWGLEGVAIRAAASVVVDWFGGESLRDTTSQIPTKQPINCGSFSSVG